LATEYVEGFHAAPSETVSVHALKRAEEKAETEEGTRQFRLTHGYLQLIEWMADRVRARGAVILLNQDVRIVRWKMGRVDVLAETPEGLQKHQGIAAIITLPLGVLQADVEEGVLFDPELPGKRRAISGIQMGAVIKITFEFKERFWPVENFNFIHSHQGLFPVWWSDGRGPLLTAWCGDGRAAWLSRESRPAIFNEAVECLCRLFNLQTDFIQRRIAAIYHHDWMTDRFSRGAYSFTPVGMIHGPNELGEPVSETLFFAGEATDCEGDQGTVQGALSSGERAAQEVLKAIRGQYAANPH
jgi:monoamine oxidase